MRFVAGLESISMHERVSHLCDDWQASMEALTYHYHPRFSEVNNVNLFLFEFQSCPLLVAVSIPKFLGVPFLSPVTKLRFHERSSHRSSAIISELLYQ